jgi:hypothetical protein
MRFMSGRRARPRDNRSWDPDRVRGAIALPSEPARQSWQQWRKNSPAKSPRWHAVRRQRHPDDAEPRGQEGHAVPLLCLPLADHQRSDRGLRRAASSGRGNRATGDQPSAPMAPRRGSIYKATSARFPDPSTRRRLAARAADVGKHWPEFPVTRTRAVLAALIERIEVSVDQIKIRLARVGSTRSSV